MSNFGVFRLVFEQLQTHEELRNILSLKELYNILNVDAAPRRTPQHLEPGYCSILSRSFETICFVFFFQDGANSAFQEAMGDTIMLGVLAPQHLYRLGLITDEQIVNNNYFSEILLFYTALSKIPQIPFGLMLDQYRWDIFSGRIKEREYNKIFWKMSEEIRGIQAPTTREEEYFDAGAKFHVADNTPYIRYKHIFIIIIIYIIKTLEKYFFDISW